jgi:hypothetical protein
LKQQETILHSLLSSQAILQQSALTFFLEQIEDKTILADFFSKLVASRCVDAHNYSYWIEERENLPEAFYLIANNNVKK